MSIVCPNCHHKEIEGAMFCSECGTKLITDDGLSTATINPVSSAITEGLPPAEAAAPEVVSDAAVSLHIVETGQILPLVGREDFTIGRVSEGQSILPDIDLTPFEAYSHGVSRLHASMKITDSNVYITDLGSSNGTRINKNKINPHTEHEVFNGDIIALGRFKLQALIRQD